MASFNRDRNPFRDQGWAVRNVEPIAEHELERVASRRQDQLVLGLSAAKMQVIGVSRDGFVEVGQFIRIDQKVMVASLAQIGASRRHAHSLQSESNGNWA